MDAVIPVEKPSLKTQVTTKLPVARATLTSGVELEPVVGTVLLTRNGAASRGAPAEEKRRATMTGTMASDVFHVTTKLPAPSLPTDGPVSRGVWSVLTRNEDPSGTPDALNWRA